MSDPNAVSDASALKRMASLGVISVALYAGLYYFEGPLLEISGRGGWAFVVPVAIAFVFSLVHGGFTGAFWDVLGIKAKK